MKREEVVRDMDHCFRLREKPADHPSKQAFTNAQMLFEALNEPDGVEYRDGKVVFWKNFRYISFEVLVGDSSFEFEEHKKR